MKRVVTVGAVLVLAWLTAGCGGGSGDSSSPTSPTAVAAPGCTGAAVPQVQVAFQSFDGLGVRLQVFGETIDRPTMAAGESVIVTRAVAPCSYEVTGQMLGRSLNVVFSRTSPFSNPAQGVELGSVVIDEGPGVFGPADANCAVRFNSQGGASGGPPPGPFNIKIRFRVSNTNAVSSSSGCGSAPTAAPPPTPIPAPTPAPGVNLAGVWTGTFRTGLRPSETHPITSWTLTQSGTSLSGPVVFGDGGGSGTLTGTVSATQLTSIVLNVVIAGLPGCSYTGSGSLAATAASMSGTLAMTFTPACVGPDLASPAATDTWTLALTK